MYTFNDVLIAPCYSEIKSRKDVNLGVKFKDLDIQIPVISANMKTITGPRMALEMGKRGAWSILHRFNTIEEAVEDFNEAKWYTPGVSIGVSGDYKERLEALYNAGARYFCIDIAHGHHILMQETIKYIKNKYSDVYIIAGNVATSEGVANLSYWGANAIKVGIGGGSKCSTRNNTGVGVPQLWALEQAYKITSQSKNPPIIIADGGIKTIGDIAKALKFADMVMLGSYLAGSMETPGNVFKHKDGSRYKVYGGSASGANKELDGNRPKFVEGITEEVPLGDHVKFLLKEIQEGLQSTCSYINANNLKEYKSKCTFIKISSSGKEESKF